MFKNAVIFIHKGKLPNSTPTYGCMNEKSLAWSETHGHADT